MSLYLDASVLLPIVVDETGSEEIGQLITENRATLWVSEFASAEVASALSRLLRMRRLTKQGGQEALVDYDYWLETQANSVSVDGPDVHAAILIVRRFDLMLRAPDALHLAICRRLGSTMMTLDRRLANAARSLDLDVVPI